MDAAAAEPTLPEPFASAIASGRPADACDAEAPSGAALLGRGRVRSQVGRFDEARRDLDAALTETGDLARIELALLDVLQRSDLANGLATAESVASRAHDGSRLLARAHHVAGLALGKLRETGRAIDALDRAASIYSELGARRELAQVRDTLGMVHQARGRPDHAVHHYALSIADKAILRDLPGLAITLGNLGRLHLAAGRVREALDCFRSNLDLAMDIGDVRGVARMHADIGRARAAEGAEGPAAAALHEAAELGRAHGLRDIEFFARQDLALLFADAGRVDEARLALDAAEAAMPGGGERYHALLLDRARAAVGLATGEAAALDLLEATVTALAEADLPDVEVPSRLRLARALVEAGRPTAAEHVLLEGLRAAASLGNVAHVRRLNDALVQLELPMTPAAHQAACRSDYVLREQLGAGGYGETWRAHDPVRCMEVAWKKFPLDRVLDPKRRAELVASARREVDAVARIRHPGVARVYGLEDLDGGAVVVVQELVKGRPLHALMASMPKPAVRDALSVAQRIAHALDALHAGGIVHRDLKPSNVVMRGSIPVLIDFGLCQMPAWTKIVGADVSGGTVAYMAPEHSLGRVDGRADIYSLGVILYEWLAGVRPIEPEGVSYEERVADARKRPPAPLSDFRPDVAPRVLHLVAQLLDKRPRRRPASAAALARSLEELIEAEA